MPFSDELKLRTFWVLRGYEVAFANKRQTGTTHRPFLINKLLDRLFSKNLYEHWLCAQCVWPCDETSWNDATSLCLVGLICDIKPVRMVYFKWYIIFDRSLAYCCLIAWTRQAAITLNGLMPYLRVTWAPEIIKKISTQATGTQNIKKMKLINLIIRIKEILPDKSVSVLKDVPLRHWCLWGGWQRDSKCSWKPCSGVPTGSWKSADNTNRHLDKEALIQTNQKRYIRQHSPSCCEHFSWESFSWME